MSPLCMTCDGVFFFHLEFEPVRGIRTVFFLHKHFLNWMTLCVHDRAHLLLCIRCSGATSVLDVIQTLNIVKVWCGFRTQQQLQSWSKQHSWCGTTLFHAYLLIALLFSHARVSSQCRLTSNVLFSSLTGSAHQSKHWRHKDLSAACLSYHWTSDKRKREACQAQIEVRYLLLNPRRVGRGQQNWRRRTACSTQAHLEHAN